MSKWTAASDVDYRNEVCGLSKADEELRLEREEEALREQRWAEFVAEYRKRYADSLWLALFNASLECTADQEFFARFAAEEGGWPNVLRAIARAIEEEEQYRKELVDRR